MPRGEHPNSRANLNKGKRFNEENAREKQKKSTESKHKKAELKELAQAWLDAEIKDKNGTVLSGGEALIQFAVKEAARGNVRAMAFIRDTAGQKPIDEQIHSINITEQSNELHKMIEEMKRNDSDL